MLRETRKLLNELRKECLKEIPDAARVDALMKALQVDDDDAVRQAILDVISDPTKENIAYAQDEIRSHPAAALRVMNTLSDSQGEEFKLALEEGNYGA